MVRKLKTKQIEETVISTDNDVEMAFGMKRRVLTSLQRDRIDEMNIISDRIRYLISEGYAVKEISYLLNLKYQHVRNVATTTLKRKRV